VGKINVFIIIIYEIQIGVLAWYIEKDRDHRVDERMMIESSHRSTGQAAVTKMLVLFSVVQWTNLPV